MDILRKLETYDAFTAPWHDGRRLSFHIAGDEHPLAKRLWMNGHYPVREGGAQRRILIDCSNVDLISGILVVDYPSNGQPSMWVGVEMDIAKPPKEGEELGGQLTLKPFGPVPCKAASRPKTILIESSCSIMQRFYRSPDGTPVAAERITRRGAITNKYYRAMMINEKDLRRK